MKPAVVFVFLATLSSVGSAAFAGEAALAPVIALHEGQQYSPKSGVLREAWDYCNNARSPVVQGIPCSQYNVQGALHVSERAIYLLAVNPDVTAGVAGLSCGIDYKAAEFAGVDVFGYWICADTEVAGGWPAAGTGNRITWDPVANCQRTTVGGEGVHALAAVFYVYAYGDGVFEITGNPDTPDSELVVIDCAGNEHAQLVPPARVGFGAPRGFNPCLADVPTLPATWGRIKQRY
jgi:hypothetical protein